jgi:ABC-type polysaccharide/polyol phosphate export permease
MNFEDIINHKFILNFKKYRYLLYELVKRNIKLTYRRSILGVFWTFISPLLYTVVLTIVFSVLFQRSIENYPVYLISGKLIFDFFAKGTRSAMGSLKGASTLKRVYVPKYIYPLSRVVGNYVMFWISLAVLVVMIIVTQVPFDLHMFYVIVPIGLSFFLVLGVGLTLSTVNVFFRDMEHLWSVILTILMWTSAIFYPASTVPEKYRFILDFNPLFSLINMSRNALLYGKAPSLMSVAFVSGIAIFFIILGTLLLYKYQDKLILYI